MVSIISFASKVNAEVRVHRDRNTGSCYDYLLQVRGEITRSDIKTFSSQVTSIKNNIRKDMCPDGSLSVQLMSHGGDVYAAMEIGRVVRNQSIRTIVPGDSECSSSCVLILGAGVSKAAVGKVGIHRPYFGSMDSNSSLNEVRRKRDRISEDIKTYLNEIDVSLSLYEMMSGVPPEKIRYLSREECESLRLDGDDPTYNEKTTAISAKQYGISSAIYRQRTEEISNKCRPYLRSNRFSEYQVCSLSIYLGISVDSARNKFSQQVSECRGLHAEKLGECLRNINLR